MPRHLQQDLNASATDISRLATATLLPGAVGTPLLSRLGGRHGRRQVLLAVLAVTVAGSVLGALADSLPLRSTTYMAVNPPWGCTAPCQRSRRTAPSPRQPGGQGRPTVELPLQVNRRCHKLTDMKPTPRDGPLGHSTCSRHAYLAVARAGERDRRPAFDAPAPLACDEIAPAETRQERLRGRRCAWPVRLACAVSGQRYVRIR
ncbi:MFS transporter [Streptomyces sp. NBC_01497]|uniref:MFS transporter n=1 Tax=Streptomyces sp. NBC_01497 TaxID=2903885 RepID=UPI003FCD6795